MDGFGPPDLNLKMSYFHNPGTVPLLGMTIGQLVDEAAEYRGDMEAIVDVAQGIRKTFSQVKDDVTQLAAGLLALGLQNGDRVGIFGPNSYEWYVSYLAVAKAGLISVTINFTYQSPELKYCLNKVRVKALICAEKVRNQNLYNLMLKVDPVIAVAKPGDINSLEVPSLKFLIVMSQNKYPGAFSYEEIKAMGTPENTQKVEDLQSMIQFDAPSNIQYTSGTTGLPKATILSHHNIVNNIYQIIARIIRSQQEISVPTAIRQCITLPFFHAYGCIGMLIGSLHTGFTCVIPSPVFNVSAVLKAVEQEKCTHMTGTPTMYVDMLQCLEKEPRDVSSLTHAAMGAAPASKELITKVTQKLGLTSVHNSYGQTEATLGIMTAFGNDSLESKTSTVGFPMDHVEVKVVDENDRVVPIGTPGELCVRGYVTMLGYWEDAEKTREILKEDRWLHTGDLFIMEKNGYGRIVGRVKDMIIRGGENVFPKEIEDFLTAHPKILDIEVVGVPDERLGEEICAFVRLQEGEQLSQKELHDFCKGKLAYYKIPKYLLITTEYPKTASGKVRKTELVKEATKRLKLSSKL